MGCRDIIRETYDSSIRMGRSAFEALGIEQPVASKMASTFEDIDRQSMIELAPLFDVNLPAEENKEYIAKVREILPEREARIMRHMKDIQNGKV